MYLKTYLWPFGTPSTSSLSILLLSATSSVPVFALLPSTESFQAATSASVMPNSANNLYQIPVSHPPEVPLDVKHYPIAPEDLKLEQVHVYVRHGERTPVGVRLTQPPGSIPEHWLMCANANRFRAAIANPYPTTIDFNLHKTVERPDGTFSDAECLLGELTDLGRQSTYYFGKALRNLYVDRLKFIPDALQSPESVYFRSTNLPRTVESMQNIIEGLYPPQKREFDTILPLLIRNGKDENLIGNMFSCKRLEILQISFARAAAEAYNHSLGNLDTKLSKYFEGRALRIDSKPRASGVLDTVRSAVAHGIQVPPEFQEKSIVDVIEKAVVDEWFGDKTEEVRRLGVGRMLGDLSNKMQKKVEHGSRDPVQILVHTTHDTAIAGLCSTFDVFDDKWPAFTASITFELFKKENKNSVDTTGRQTLLNLFGNKPPAEFYVRMRHQNKNMILPICAEEGKHLKDHPEFCSLKAFRDRVAELTPKDWESECSPAGKP